MAGRLAGPAGRRATEGMRMRLSVIIPAHDEAAYLPACLDSLAAQTLAPAAIGGAEIIVAANGCRDATAAVARDRAAPLARAGYALRVLELPACGKPGALNAADRAARGEMRAYLDADVVLAPELLAQLVAALDTPAPRYASGRLEVAPAHSWVTRRFAGIWTALPFMTEGVPGAGLFAVNAAGRARWDRFPEIISDDTYVRLLFAPEERVGVPARYLWPMAEGYAALVRVRRRQDAGVREIARRWPALMANEAKRRPRAGEIARLVLRRPVGAAVYAAVLGGVRARAGDGGWSRGR